MAEGTLTIEWSANALADLGRFAKFLQEAASDLAPSVADKIIAKTRIIGERPLIGRPIVGTSYQQFVIHALNAPYIVQYLVDGNRVIILRVFHSRERRPGSTD